MAIACARAALELVEGEPLANALSGYSWWEAEGHGGRVAAALVDAACTMASLAAEAGHFALAWWGLERARVVEPYSEVLSRAAMQLAAAEGDAERLRLEWRECQRRLDALDPGCSPSPRTESLYGELSRLVHSRSFARPGHRRSATAAGRRLVGTHDVFEAGDPAAFDQHGVTRAQGPQELDRLVDVGHLGGAVERRLVADDLDPQPSASIAIRRCSASVSLPSSAMRPSRASFRAPGNAASERRAASVEAGLAL